MEIKKKMESFVFFGTPEFAVIVLDKLVSAGFVPRAVICNPDRPVGRHHVITPPKIKKYVIDKSLPVEILQPENPKDILGKLSAIRPDFFVVAAYGKILPKEIIELPRFGAVGVHSSLLPKYRGTSPIHGAILAGDKKTGATVFLMDEKMDHGPILAQREIPIADRDTHETLFPKIWDAGGEMLAEMLPDFLAGKIKPRIQDEKDATYTKKFTSADGFVEPQDLEAALGGDVEKAVAVDRKIRAFGVEPGVWTFRQIQDEQKRVKLLEAEIKNGKLALRKMQVEGEKPKDIESANSF